MKVLVYEDNLMWSSRLTNALSKLGYEPILASAVSCDAPVAIVNLGAPDLQHLVPLLREQGIVTLGHAGHKEKELHSLGAEVGCDILATNSELTFKIESLMDRAKTMARR